MLYEVITRKRYPEKEIIYYILPQAWAWKKGRIPVLEKTITKLCSILPFEPSYYSKNAPIEYVGHPLLDEITVTKSDLNPSGIVTFMPGSRPGEIKRLMGVRITSYNVCYTKLLRRVTSCCVGSGRFTSIQGVDAYG